MESEKTIHDVIKERMKLPEEVKGFIKINIFLNILMAIVMLVASLIINITYSKVTTSSFEEYIKIFQIIFAIVTIIFFETAYKKDSFLISFYGIEMFIFSIAIMFVPYFYIFKSQLNVLVILSAVFSLYYVIKSIFTGIYIRNDYLKNNISDVKEIVKDTKKGYIDEKSTKTLRENKKIVKKQDDIQKENTTKKDNNTSKEEKIKKESKTTSKSKKKSEEKVEIKKEKVDFEKNQDVKKDKKKKEEIILENKVEKQEKSSKKEYTAEGLNENLNKLKKMKEKKENNK